MMNENKILVLIVIKVILGIYWVTGQQITASHKSNCFQEHKSKQCEDNWIQICSDYYVCDMVITLQSPPKRIGFVDGEILVLIGSQMYNIVNGSLISLLTRKFIPPWDEFADRNDNRYYTADGTTYMFESKTNKEIEISTTGEHSFNQLVYDSNNDRLFILAFKPTPKEKVKGGSLFAINTNAINTTEGNKIQAENVIQAGDNITAMTIEGDANKLLLGLKTEEGGKLIRLIRKGENPCSQNINDDKKNAIIDIIKETQEKLLKIFEESYTTTESKNSLPYTTKVDSKPMELENARLKRELYVATAKFNKLTSKLLVFKRSMNNIPVVDNIIVPPFPPINNRERFQTNTLNQDSPGQSRSINPSQEKCNEGSVCVKIQEIRNMVTQCADKLNAVNTDLRSILSNATHEVDMMLKELSDENN